MTDTRASAPAAASTINRLRSLVGVPDGPHAGRHVAQAWLASRGLILLVALALGITQGRSMGDMVNNWDAALYAQLAHDGYLHDPRHTLMAFFPGLPALLHLGLAVGIPTQVSGVVISVVCSVLAAAALLRMGGPWAAIAWLFAPTAVFTMVPYTESLFCAAAFWAWERARAGRWGWACLLTCAACTVRVSGVFLIGALAVLLLTSWAEPGASREPWRVEVRRRGRRLGWLVPPALVVAGFMAYLHHLTGSWTAWYHAQATGWVRGLTWPWQSAMNTWQVVRPGAYPEHPVWAPVFRFEVASMILGLITTGWCLGRRRYAEASWVGVQVLAFSLSYWFFSVNRAVLLWFPLWIMLAELGQHRPRRRAAAIVWRVLVGAVAVGMTVTMLWWCWLFFTGRWSS